MAQLIELVVSDGLAADALDDVVKVAPARRDGGDAGSGQRDLRRACEFDSVDTVPSD